mmetsp:Transcript_40037/g.105844  ORF Transcript_40037/g.105844 Transcript_40037/m.105844 type:complete len:200 (+) Transcript_40037:61-660(+)
MHDADSAISARLAGFWAHRTPPHRHSAQRPTRQHLSALRATLEPLAFQGPTRRIDDHSIYCRRALARAISCLPPPPRPPPLPAASAARASARPRHVASPPRVPPPPLGATRVLRASRPRAPRVWSASPRRARRPKRRQIPARCRQSAPASAQTGLRRQMWSLRAWHRCRYHCQARSRCPWHSRRRCCPRRRRRRCLPSR